MTQSYTTYTDITLNAFKFNPKSQDIINKKSEILSLVSNYYNTDPSSVLFFGFNPWILGFKCKSISVTEISVEARELLDKYNIKYTYIDPNDLHLYHKKFQWVVAGEEYFTFAGFEVEQRIKVETLSALATDLIVTTLRDYKNQDFKDREFSQPLAVRNSKESMIFLEYNDYDFDERNMWRSTVYQLHQSECLVYGVFDRCSMYFKQLAKFSIDAGAQNFLVHKNLMYKSLIKKNYEHVISIPIK